MTDCQKHFEKLFRDKYDNVVSYLYVYCKDKELARNIAQDAFLSLWENYESVTEEGAASYVFRAARNKMLNHLNRVVLNDRFNDYSRKRLASTMLESIEGDALHKVYGQEIERLLQVSISKMSPKVREVFMMSRREMKKNREIADILGVSESTVELRIMTALRIIRKEMSDFLVFLFFWHFFH